VANHRAERRAPSRRLSAAPEASPKPVSTAGKRKAVKPARAVRSTDTAPVLSPAPAPAPTRAPAPVASRPVAPIAARRAAPVPTRAAAPVPTRAAAPAGARAAEPRRLRVEPQISLAPRAHAGGRRSLLPGLPSAPTLIGAAALALAAVGATVSQQALQPASDGYQKFSAQASVLNAASSIGSSDALSGRQRAVSRDSQREALQDAASAELQSAAESQAQERNAALAALAASAEKHADQIAKNLWVFALPPGTYRVSYNYGQCSYLWANCHTGEDFSAPTGTPISSIANGVVTEAGYDGSYGNKTVVTLEDGTELWYCHQTSILVSVGDSVRGGQQIGTVGSTGNTTGPHLHLEVRPGGGDPVDPIAALRVHGLDL
jgi:murein DD-endopeptidase MepM/ murein hydrolase activator NlpD